MPSFLTLSVKLLLAVALFASLSACSQAPASTDDGRGQGMQEPRWITNPPQVPGMAYGVGSMEIYGNKAEAMKRAVQLARVDMISQLKVTVSGDFTNTVEERSATGQESNVQRVMRNHVRSQVARTELDEVPVIKTHTDQTYAYALVELDRNQAAARLKRDMGKLDNELSGIAVLQPQGSSLQKLQPLLPALALFAQREQLNERLMLVSMDRQGEALTQPLMELQQRINGLISELQVSLELKNEDAMAMEGGMLEALTEQGLRISRSEPDLIFEISSSLSNRQQNGRMYAFADSRVVLKDGNGRVLSSFSKQARGVSSLADVARQKAAQAVAKLLAEELAVTLASRLN